VFCLLTRDCKASQMIKNATNAKVTCYIQTMNSIGGMIVYKRDRPSARVLVDPFFVFQ